MNLKRLKLHIYAGRRQFPSAVATEEDDRAFATRSDGIDFQKKTTQECYEEFPMLVRSSFPLYIRTEGRQVFPQRNLFYEFAKLLKLAADLQVGTRQKTVAQILKGISAAVSCLCAQGPRCCH